MYGGYTLCFHNAGSISHLFQVAVFRVRSSLFQVSLNKVRTYTIYTYSEESQRGYRPNSYAPPLCVRDAAAVAGIIRLALLS